MTVGPLRRVGARRAVLAVALCGYAWWAVGLAPFSAQGTVAVVAAGVAAVAAGARDRRPAHPVGADTADAARRMVPWAALALAGTALQLAAYLQHPRADHPTLSSLTNALLDSQPARAVAFVGWLLATVELARR